MFWKGCVVGASLHYKRSPMHDAVKAEAVSLPFFDRCCPFVVCCDVFEHIPPNLRINALAEMTRVSNDKFILVFPTGEAAINVYHSFFDSFRFAPSPGWLKQHLRYGLPDVQPAQDWLLNHGWDVELKWFESADLHHKLINFELRFGGKFITYSLMRLFGPRIIHFLHQENEDLKMRIIMDCTRLDQKSDLEPNPST